MVQILIVLAILAAIPMQGRKPEAMSLLGKALFTPELPAERRATLEKDLAAARQEFERNPVSVEAAIWLGRRTAYLGRYRDAIEVFTAAIATHPTDARLYRHRGHRYITVREFDHAIADLQKASTLASGPDEIEPDGQPNAKNIPTGTLKTNIYYHLGLAYYLKGQFPSAADGFAMCRELSKNPDMDVAAAHWQYMSLRRMSRDPEAVRALARITADVPIIENFSYHKLLMMYKGATQPEALLASTQGQGIDAVTIGYGVANWHFYNGRQDVARTLFTNIVEQNAAAQWAGFGYIAAEAELARMR